MEHYLMRVLKSKTGNEKPIEVNFVQKMSEISDLCHLQKSRMQERSDFVHIQRVAFFCITIDAFCEKIQVFTQLIGQTGCVGP